MNRLSFIAFFGVSLTNALAAAPQIGSPASIGCKPQIVREAAPVTAGPYFLANAYCPSGLGRSYTFKAPLVSPDGHRFQISTAISLLIGSMGSSAAPRAIGTWLMSGDSGYGKTSAFAWSDDSKAILGVRRETQWREFANGSLTPIEIPVDGEPRPLPLLKHKAGGLDGLRWVGGGGLALAEFGTKGRSYYPKHDDPTPTLAIVDGRRGTVLQSASMPPSGDKWPNSLGDIDARVDREGKVFALFPLGSSRWFEWKQGEVLHETQIHPGAGVFWKFTLSPDLKTVLIAHDLVGGVLICEYYSGTPRRPECEEPPTGAIADLWNIETGHKLWGISGKPYNASRTYYPAVSLDGRYALISMPAGNNSQREAISLISMADGHEIQRFNKPKAFDLGLRFGRDGSFSIDGPDAILTYQLAKKHAAD